jgi:ABC-type Zn uptake system ZnuABC Zn-binding protein ZnuA
MCRSSIETRAGHRFGGAVHLGIAVLAGVVASAAAAEPLRVVATTPELGSLARAIGGDAVGVTVLAKPTEDPHFVEAKPSFVKELSQADLYVSNGLELEMGYAPVLLQGARNPRVRPGAPGYVDASVAITPVDVPVVTVDRSMGDVHPLGNPHYLLDPVLGLKVAALLRDAMTRLRPDQAEQFARHYDALKTRIDDAMVGPALAKRYGAEKLATLFEYGRMMPFLEQQGTAAELDGWLGEMAPYFGTKAVDDHPLWPYFTRRFGLQIVGHMEPKPGVPPTTKHLQELVELMKANQVPLILAAAYYDPRHAEVVSNATGARVARMANQAGARPGTDDYVDMVDYNVQQVVRALRGAAG